MDLTSKSVIKNLLKKYQVRLSKRLGQNFLVDKRVLKKFIKAANLQPNDIVLEIGPGIGTITQELAKKVKRVIAVEKASRMIEILQETLKDFPNIKIVPKDILSYKLQVASYKIVANLPFYITAPVIRKFLESKNPPKEMILMVQKEVGQRICAKPLRMNLLAISVQFYAKPKIISYVSKKSSWPSPQVDSAILRITPIKTDKKLISPELFFKIVKAGFSQPRKQLVNNLSKGLKLDKEKVKSWLLKNNISPNQRAETLDINKWIKLTNSCELFNC